MFFLKSTYAYASMRIWPFSCTILLGRNFSSKSLPGGEKKKKKKNTNVNFFLVFQFFQPYSNHTVFASVKIYCNIYNLFIVCIGLTVHAYKIIKVLRHYIIQLFNQCSKYAILLSFKIFSPILISVFGFIHF